MIPFAIAMLASGDAGARAGFTAVEPSTPIVGGAVVEPGDWPAVVAIDDGESLCSGTRISASLIVTAAHCLSDLPPGHELRVHYGDAAFEDAVLDVEDYGIHPLYCGSPDCGDDTFDFAYVRVEKPGVLPGEPAALVLTQEDWDAGVFVGAAMMLVGYGADEDGAVGTKREVLVGITDVSSKGLRLRAGGGGLDSCTGDSGGPGWVLDAEGHWRLVGVLSVGAANCGRGGTYGNVYGALHWLVEDAGFELDIECPSFDCVDPSVGSGGRGCGVEASREHASRALAWFVLSWIGCSRVSAARARPQHVQPHAVADGEAPQLVVRDPAEPLPDRQRERAVEKMAPELDQEPR